MPQVRAQTEVQAANLALSRIRQPPIASFAENSTRARVVARELGGARDALLVEYDWHFCAEWIVPAADATTPSPGPWAKRYPLTDDVLKVRLVNDSNGADIGADAWAIESTPTGEVKALYTDQIAPLCKVTMRVTTPRLWEPLFITVFALRLGALIAPPILKSNTLADKLDQKADELLDTARKVDAREAAKGEITRSTTWTQVRGLGGRCR